MSADWMPELPPGYRWRVSEQLEGTLYKLKLQRRLPGGLWVSVAGDSVSTDSAGELSHRRLQAQGHELVRRRFSPRPEHQPRAMMREVNG